jgi:hypothetical protein
MEDSLALAQGGGAEGKRTRTTARLGCFRRVAGDVMENFEHVVGYERVERGDRRFLKKDAVRHVCVCFSPFCSSCHIS